MARFSWTLAAALLVTLAALSLVSTSDRVQAQPATAIDICCAWNSNLADGDLTYKISGGDATAQQVVRDAVEAWDTALTGLTLTEVSGRTKADINIKFKSGGGVVQGMALRKFDGQGFIASVSLSISGKAFGSPNNAPIVGQITLHEMGHALGVNHANGDGVVMSPTVSGGSTTLTACDIAAAVAANHWKLVDGDPTPHQPHVGAVAC